MVICLECGANDLHMVQLMLLPPIIRVTTLQTLWNSLTFPWQCAALMPMSSGTHSMPVLLVYVNDYQVPKYFIMITKDKITVDATEYPYERKYSTSNEHFLETFPWQDFFPDIPLTIPWLLTKSLTFPWHVSNSLTFPGFPDKWSPCIISCFSKIQNGLPFWCRLTQVVLEKGR